MNVLVNHCWCSDCNWGGVYECKVIVSISLVKEGKSYYDGPSADWESLMTKDTQVLKTSVLEWLLMTIKDRKHNTHTKGWAIGSDTYSAENKTSFNIFFHRIPDAMRFIKTWSEYKKPVNFLNYFKDERRELDLTTGKVKKIRR